MALLMPLSLSTRDTDRATQTTSHGGVDEKKREREREGGREMYTVSS